MVVCSFHTLYESHRKLVRRILGKRVKLIHIQCAIPGCAVCRENQQQRTAQCLAPDLLRLA